MFRIDKELVLQLAQPADIPLIPVPLPDPAPEPTGTLEERVAAANIEAAGTDARAEAFMQETRQKARQILLDAEQQAALTLQQAEQEAARQADAIRADAWQAGFEEGRQEALHEAQKEREQQMQAAQQQISSLLEQISVAREELFAAMEGEIIDLVLAVAGKITHAIVAQDRGALDGMIRHALQQMRRDGKISVQVSEEHYNAFFQEGSVNFVLGDETVIVNVSANPELLTGDLLLESGDETVNAGVDSQLKYITLAFGRPWEPGL